MNERDTQMFEQLRECGRKGAIARREHDESRALGWAAQAQKIISTFDTPDRHEAFTVWQEAYRQESGFYTKTFERWA